VEKKMLMPPGATVVPSVVPMGCSSRFCTVVLKVNWPVPPLYATAPVATFTYTFWLPTIRSPAAPVPGCGGRQLTVSDCTLPVHCSA